MAQKVSAKKQLKKVTKRRMFIFSSLRTSECERASIGEITPRIRSGNWNDISLIDFDSNRSHDCVDRDHEAGIAFVANKNALRATQRAINNLHSVPDVQKGMVFGNDIVRQPVPEGFNVVSGERRRLAIEGDKPDYAGKLQHL